MSGLIPLLLPSSTGSRSSIVSTSTETSRRASFSPFPAPPSSLIHRRQQSLPSLRTARRGSFVPPATLPIIPFTSGEWKKVIDEVKRKYLNRKYRACSARCCEILENLKDTSTVEPLYLIYLHFYAASSFELCARPLSYSSNYRTRLLRDAQTHYDKAEKLIRSTEENVTQRTRCASSCSTTSSVHSPGLSTSVRSSVSSTTLSSPRTSVCSAEDGSAPKPKSRPVVKAKKKVSFSGLNDLIEFQPEPYIRPDSPTLGWEDDFLPQQSDDSFPLFIADKMKPKPLSTSLRTTGPAQPFEAQPEIVERPSSAGDHGPTEESSPTDEKFDLDVFLQNRSMNKMCAQLSALRLQVSWHRDGVAALLAAPDDTPETPTLSVDVSPAPPTPFTPPRLTRANTLPTETELGPSYSERSAPWTAPNLRDSFASSPSFDNPRAISRPASAASTIRCSDEALQQRIERLRAGGWQRKRFDNRRYEALREQVLVELGA
ncbi:hypothetical protein GGS26DRAFT_58614 [Hypomontagnella submonticulosa]|nr:hypothetical protein GGS26DRAFT_58614 [Hypomontagnella submonticulosa]